MVPHSSNAPRLRGLLVMILASAAMKVPASHAAASSPYGGTPWPVPGVIEVEQYDLGGEGIGFHWNGLTPAWPGSDFLIEVPPGREPDSPSLVPKPPSVEGPTDCVALRAGEWLQYSIHCTEAGPYSFQFSTAEPPHRWDPGFVNCTATDIRVPGEASFHVELDGKDVTGPVEGLPETVCPRFWIPKGDHRIRVIVDRVKEGGIQGTIHWSDYAWCLDFIRIQRVVTPLRPVLVAGSEAGFADGAGPVARFQSDARIAGELAGGELLLLDPGNGALRGVARSGWVRTLAGHPGNPPRDGLGTNAGIGTLLDVAVDPAGVIWVLEARDDGEEHLRRLDPDGRVSSVLSGRPVVQVRTPIPPAITPPSINTFTVPMTRVVSTASGRVDLLGPVVQRVLVGIGGQGCTSYKNVEWHVRWNAAESGSPEPQVVETPLPLLESPPSDRHRLVPEPGGGFRLQVEEPPGFFQEAAPGVVVDMVRRAMDGTFFAMIAPAGLHRLDPSPEAVSLHVVPEGSGRVVGGPFLAAAGETIRIEALVASEWVHFEGWSDGSTDNPRTLQLDHDLFLTARFVPGAPEGSGVIPGTLEVLPDGRIRFHLGGNGTAYRYLVTVSHNLRSWRTPIVPSEIGVQAATLSSPGAARPGLFLQPWGDRAVVTLTADDLSHYVQILTVRPD